MHDIDRTLAQDSELEFEDAEYEDEFEDEEESEYEDEYESEYEDEYDDELEYEGGRGVFSDSEEMELAAELLSTSDEGELDHFFGKLFKRVARKVGRAIKSRKGGLLRRLLKKAAKTALPIAGGFVGGPVGAGLARAGGRIFGLELEGLSREDQDFEIARRVVRLAGDAAKNAAKPTTTGSAVKDAKIAVVKAAKKHAPGLVRPGRSPMAMAGAVASGRSGRWIRRGRKVVLMGI